MHRSTADFIAALRANRGPVKRVYQPIDKPCDRCFKVPCMCSGESARYRRRAFHAQRRDKCTKCGEPARDDLTLCQRCADFHAAINAEWRAARVEQGR